MTKLLLIAIAAAAATPQFQGHVNDDGDDGTCAFAFKNLLLNHRRHGMRNSYFHFGNKVLQILNLYKTLSIMFVI